MNPPIAIDGTTAARRFPHGLLAHAWRFPDRIVTWAWLRVSSRRGVAWLGDVLSACNPARPSAPSQEAEEDAALFAGKGHPLAEQLDAIGNGFVKDILVRRAACAMAQLHHRGGYLGYAHARYMQVTGVDVCFAQLDGDLFDAWEVTTAQARDWLLFTTSVASHYRDRIDDLAGILHRAMRLLEPGTVATLRQALERLAFIDHRWANLLGPRVQLLRLSVHAIRQCLSEPSRPSSRRRDALSMTAVPSMLAPLINGAGSVRQHTGQRR